MLHAVWMYRMHQIIYRIRTLQKGIYNMAFICRKRNKTENVKEQKVNTHCVIRFKFFIVHLFWFHFSPYFCIQEFHNTVKSDHNRKITYTHLLSLSPILFYNNLFSYKNKSNMYNLLWCMHTCDALAGDLKSRPLVWHSCLCHLEMHSISTSDRPKWYLYITYMYKASYIYMTLNLMTVHGFFVYCIYIHTIKSTRYIISYGIRVSRDISVLYCR